jgi:hypothetical protein
MLAADKSKLDGVEAGAQVTSFARVQTALGVASSAVSINAQRLTSVADPTAAQDAATKAYVDALAQGLDTKASCRLVSTTNMGTLGGAQVIDGIVTQTGDRLLIVGQTTASQNGIYIGSGINWLRAPDADTSAKVTSGMYVFVTEGTANADSGWALITPDPIVLGTTALTFTQVTGAGQITAGAGLTKSGNTLNVVAHADASIVVAADSVQVGVITDAQHGTRAGGTTHATVIAAGAAGFMSGSDKTKLDGIATGAAAVLSVTPLQVDGSSGNGGAAVTASRSDHRHQVTTGSPVALTLAATTADGTSNNLARADHVHALPATAAPAALTVGAASSAGSAVTLPRSDHVHAMPGAATTGAAGFMSAADKTKLDGISTSAAALASTAPLEDTGIAAVGVGTTAARADHQHPTVWKAACVGYVNTETFNPAGGADSVVEGVSLAVGDRVLVTDIITEANCGIWVVVTVGTGSNGTWSLVETMGDGELVCVESRASLFIGLASAYGHFREFLASASLNGLMSANDFLKLAGVAFSAAAVTSSAPTQITVTTAAAGSGTSAARSDHVHSVATAAPTALTVGGSVNAGSSTSLARADHVHAMPGTATTGAAGFMSAADKARVDVGALPYSASVANNTWTIANAAGTKTLPSSAVVGDTVAILVIIAGVNIAAGSGNNIVDASGSGFTTISSVPWPALYTFRAGQAGFWFLGDNVASASSPALPGLMSAADKSKLNGITAGADPTMSTLANAAGAVSVNSQRVTNVATPTATTDAVNKTYIDNILLAMPRTNGCRLSGHAGNAVMPADNATCTTLYFHPHVSDIIWLYVNATQWLPCRVPSGGLSLALSGLTVGRPYDVFIVAPTTWSPAAATYTIELVAWTSTVTRASALQNQGGFYTLGSDPQRRYVGTIYARAANSFAWVRTGYTSTTAKCDLWNADNRVEAVFYHETAWTGSNATATPNAWFMASSGHKFEFMQGIATIEPLSASMQIGVNSAGTANQGYCGIALNSSVPAHGGRAVTATGEVTTAHTELYDVSPQGANYLQFMLLGTATAVLFYTTDDPAGAVPVYYADARTRFMY